MDDFNRIGRIMVAVGVMEGSQALYNYAARLAMTLESELFVASIINIRDVEAVRSVADMGYEVDQDHYVSDVRKERRAYIDKLVEKGPTVEKGLHIVIRVGNPIDELLKLIEERAVDMIVMGPKGRTNLENVFVGSVASRLFRRSPVTVVSYRGVRG